MCPEGALLGEFLKIGQYPGLNTGQQSHPPGGALQTCEEIETVSNNSMLPRLVLISQGSELSGSRILGKSKNRFTFTGLKPAKAATR